MQRDGGTCEARPGGIGQIVESGMDGSLRFGGACAEDKERDFVLAVAEDVKERRTQRRQPESAGMVRTTMFLGIAFTEALALFGFVLAFIISG